MASSQSSLVFYCLGFFFSLYFSISLSVCLSFALGEQVYPFLFVSVGGKAGISVLMSVRLSLMEILLLGCVCVCVCVCTHVCACVCVCVCVHARSFKLGVVTTFTEL